MAHPPAVSLRPVTSLSRACVHHPPCGCARLGPAQAWVHTAQENPDSGTLPPTHLQQQASLQAPKPHPRHNHTEQQLRETLGPSGPLSPPTETESHPKVSACLLSEGARSSPVLPHPTPMPTHPHKPRICHSLCCHGKGVVEAILLLGGGGGGGCCCCCCHGGSGPEGGGGGCPLGGGGGGGIMPIGGGGIIPVGRQSQGEGSGEGSGND